jgi:hypothetical protein
MHLINQFMCMVLVHGHDASWCLIGNIDHGHAMVEVDWNSVKFVGNGLVYTMPGG